MSFFSRWLRSITVDEVKIVKPFVFDPVDEGETITLMEDACVELAARRFVERHGKWKKYPVKIVANFKAGFKLDGASTVKAHVNGFVPAYIAGDDAYNAAPFIHDGLYIKSGRIDGAKLSREECDDVLRGIWRESGRLNRFLAGIADIGIWVVARGKNHWGNDGYKCGDRFSATLTYLDD